MSTAKTKLDTGLVRELAAILREADLGEVEIEHDGLRIRVSKPAAPVMQSAVMAAPVAAAPVAAAAAPAAAGAPAAPAVSDNAIKSPMVGTVYLSPEPGTKQFFNIGDKVKKGDTLMLVEAMKTFNPVEADRAGTLTALYVTDSQPVEFGEPLALIE
ncbi:acetyl-CoA carboxylase biotin carboxyl carrier protein [Hyphomonas sp.]|jgi:acetyl-CoA carboxylase biotin carboxyl carrier protein|uniref:acetyl-CoA carboxylase biotin carboxyl carrier protein n=1 Tax=Hyphomonas sp. TaxID=87 RepID=UPI0035632E88